MLLEASTSEVFVARSVVFADGWVGYFGEFHGENFKMKCFIVSLQPNPFQGLRWLSEAIIRTSLRWSFWEPPKSSFWLMATKGASVVVFSEFVCNSLVSKSSHGCSKQHIYKSFSSTAQISQIQFYLSSKAVYNVTTTLLLYSCIGSYTDFSSISTVAGVNLNVSGATSSNTPSRQHS